MPILSNEILGAHGQAEDRGKSSVSSSLSRPRGSGEEVAGDEDEDDSASMLAACAAIESAIADAERLEEVEAADEGDSRSSSPPAPYAPMFSPRRAPSPRDEATPLPVPAGTSPDPVYLTADGYTSLGALGDGAENDYATAAQVGLDDAESDEEADAGASEYVDVASGMTPEARGRLTAVREEEPKQHPPPQPLLHASAEGCANAFVLILDRPQRRR
jgi:hypothetical protein